MFRLIQHEFRKHMNRVFLLITAAMLLINLTVTVIGNLDVFTKDGRAAQQVRTDMMELYLVNPEEYERLYEEYEAADDAYEKSLTQNLLNEEIPIAYYADQLTAHIDSYSDSSLFRDTQGMIRRDDAFHSAVGQLLYDSYSRLSETEKGTYLYSYYINLILNYEPLHETELPAVQIEGWNEYFADTTPVLFLLIAVVFRTSGVFILENRAGFTPILHITKNKGKLIGAKLVYTLAESVILTLLFTLTPLLLYAPALKGGTAPIQCLEAFTYAHLPVSIVEFLLLLTLVRVVFFGILSLILASAGWLTGTEAAPAVLAIGLALLPKVTMSGSTFDFLSVLHGTVFFTQYRAADIFGFCVYLMVFLMAVFGLLFAAVLVVASIVRRNSYMTRFASSGNHREQRITGKGVKMYGLMRNEGRKSVVTAPYLLLLVGFLAAKAIFSTVYFNSGMDSDERVYRTYAQKFAGELSAAEEAISEEQDYLNAALSEYEPAKERYKTGEITQEVLRTYQNRYNYAQTSAGGFSRFRENYSYLQSQSENHHNIRIFYDTGIRKLIFSTPDILLILCVTLFVQQICTVENDKFIAILRTSKYGRSRTWRKKYSLALLTAAVLYLAFTAADLMVLRLNFGFSDWSAGLACIKEFQHIASDMAIGQFMLIQKTASLVGYLLYTGVVFSFALFFRNMFFCAAMSMTWFIPMILAGLGVPYMDVIDTGITLAPVYVSETLPYYGVCAVIGGILLYVTAQKWVRGYPGGGTLPRKFGKVSRRSLIHLS